MTNLLFIKDLAIISYIITYIIEFSGITTEINKTIYRLRKKKYNYQPLIKPFGCSVCMTFWITIIYSLVFNYSILYSIFFGVSNALFVNIHKRIINYYISKTF